MRRDRVRAGVRWGGAVAAVAAGALALAVAAPGLRPFLDDTRVQRLEPIAVGYHALVRVPFGTVLLEELAFRGALLGALARCTNLTRAAAGSSAVFGFWHVRPTRGLLDANDIADDPVARAAAVGAAIVATAVGGMFFCVLRMRSDSTLAPIVAHTAMNSLGVLASAITR